MHGTGGSTQSLLPCLSQHPFYSSFPGQTPSAEQALCIAGGHLTRPAARVTALPTSPTAEASRPASTTNCLPSLSFLVCERAINDPVLTPRATARVS